jgi:glycosyltransferase involved in cell wall biosynthesis
MAPDITLFPIQQTMPSPLISVIVPIYNMESLLPRCLDSLAAQTLRDLEIICVDDGSTDGSGGIVRKYASGDSRFRLITQENSGRA